MSAKEIDDYLSRVPEPQRSTLEVVRRRILEVIPDAEQCMSYGMPAFRVGGKVLAGFAANKRDLSYYPHSGAVLGQLADALAGHPQTRGALHFPNTTPLPTTLLRQLINAKWRIAFGSQGPAGDALPPSSGEPLPLPPDRPPEPDHLRLGGAPMPPPPQPPGG